jgi:hypothetical protein
MFATGGFSGDGPGAISSERGAAAGGGAAGGVGIGGEGFVAAGGTGE